MTSPTTKVTPRTTLVHIRPKAPCFAGFALPDSELVAVSATLVLAPVVAVAATLSGEPDVWSVVWAFAGVGLGLVDFEGLPIIKDQNELNHDRFDGFALFARGGAEAPDSVPAVAGRRPDGPRVCSVVWTFVGFACCLFGCGLPNIKAQNDANHDRLTGVLISGGRAPGSVTGASG